MTDGTRGRSGQGVDDPHWVDTAAVSEVTVMMSGRHAVAYQRWLRQHGLCLFSVPSMVQGTDFAVGVRDTAMFFDYRSESLADDPLTGDGHR